MTAESKIGVFGGTFDPLHCGHLAVARHAKNQFGLDKVLFVPALIPPHKASHRDMTPAPYRYRMAEIAVRTEPSFEVSDVEFNRPDVSYTVDTLRALQNKYAGSRFYLILGADSVAEFPNWRETGEILKMADILAARRPGTVVTKPAFPLKWIEMPEMPVSSSEVRSRLRATGELDEGILPSEVLAYIRKMNLYGTKCP